MKRSATSQMDSAEIERKLVELIIDLFVTKLEYTESRPFSKITATTSRLYNLRQLGIQVFDGDSAGFSNWLYSYVNSITSRPIDLLSTAKGIERVRMLLLQKDFGVPP